MHGVYERVLDALARALRLDDAERQHLFDLARAAQPTLAPRRGRAAKKRIRPSVQHVLDAITGAAAFGRNDRLDILAANQIGRALYSEMFAGAVRPPNSARFIFLDRLARVLRRLGSLERGSGTILFTTGGAAIRPYPLRAGVGISFAGEVAYARMLHEELAPRGIHVAHTAIGGRIGRGEDHEPDDVAEEAARDFVALLALTLTMSDLFGREKLGRLPRPLASPGSRWCWALREDD